MRYCVSGRQPYSIMKKADEIKVNYNDRDRIMDFVEKLPDKTIILDVPGDEADWNTWYMYADKFAEFYIALHNLNRAHEFNDSGVKWYWPYPITSYYELKGILALNPYYILLGAPLVFDLEHVHNMSNALIRIVPNVAYDSYIPRADGICGHWVRPEDLKYYAPYVNSIEFVTDDLEKERRAKLIAESFKKINNN
jgi:hypothetical protein